MKEMTICEQMAGDVEPKDDDFGQAVPVNLNSKLWLRIPT